jgi:hypothetical protein
MSYNERLSPEKVQFIFEVERHIAAYRYELMEARNKHMNDVATEQIEREQMAKVHEAISLLLLTFSVETPVEKSMKRIVQSWSEMRGDGG